MAVSGVQNNDIVIKKQELTRINGEITANNGAIQTNQTNVDENNTSIQSNTTAQSETSSNISNVTNQITDVQSRASGVQSELNSVQTALNDLSPDDANYEDLSNQLSSLQLSMSDLERMETDLNGQKGNFEATLSTQKTEGDNLQQTSSELTQEGNSLNQTKTTLSDKKNKKEQEIARAEQEERKRNEEANKRNELLLKQQQTVLPNDATRVNNESVLIHQMGVVSGDNSGLETENGFLQGKNTASVTVDAFGETSERVLKTVKSSGKVLKTAGKVVGNVGSAFDAGISLYQYSQGEISGEQAAKSTFFAAADVGIAYIPYVGLPLSAIGTENIYNEGCEVTNDYIKCQQKTKQALKKGDFGTAAAGVVQNAVQPLVLSGSIVYGALERKTYGIMQEWAPEAAETMHKYYTKAEQLLRDPEALKDGVVTVATKAKDVITSGFDRACEFFGISDAGENVKKVKRGTKKIVRTPQAKARAKARLTTQMQQVFTAIDNQANNNLRFLKRK